MGEAHPTSLKGRCHQVVRFDGNPARWCISEQRMGTEAGLSKPLPPTRHRIEALAPVGRMVAEDVFEFSSEEQFGGGAQVRRKGHPVQDVKAGAIKIPSLDETGNEIVGLEITI